MRLSDFDLCCRDDVEELALTLHTRHHGHFFAAALLDPTGRVVELSVHDEPWADVHTALDWATCAIASDDTITELVLLSSVAEACALHDSNLTVFQVTRRGLADMGVDLVDWLQTDGLDSASLAEESGLDPWTGLDG